MDEVIDQSIREVIQAFLKNPWQFHGDTGIMQYLFHRLLCNDNGNHFRIPGTPQQTETLLLQSEHYTQARYQFHGKAPGPGRLDFGIIGPQCVAPDGRFRHHAAAIRGIEVGRNKSLKKMGDLDADLTEQDVLPGDAVKLVRELRSDSPMSHGYLLEFYDGFQWAGLARAVFDYVTMHANSQGVELRVCVVLRGSEEQGHAVSTWPDNWLHNNNWKPNPLPGIDTIQPAGGGQFLQHCTPSTEQLAKKLAGLGVPVRWGQSRSMTISKPRGTGLLRIGNKNFAPANCICDIADDVWESFLQHGIQGAPQQAGVGNHVVIDDQLNIDEVVAAVRDVIVIRA